ncbi:peptidase M23-like protein [Prosthecobacter fusiformis]|uniref:Peptidase M23-like protein n=1 Tax=Prosthecobacter fusiformis TaxID=48464 RepID=A0A4R7SPK2_9BACT|nr:M23 family metallopeptidase [Prosthecobacter fusiformis]TDU81142.1 peptidase M23-like protein [Prosthecobacter fusiformis]
MRLFTWITLILLSLGGWVAWEEIGVREWMQQWQPKTAKPLDPAFLRLNAWEIASLPLALRFDHPMGSEHAALTYNAQPFRITRHLGDDLNGIGGGNSDLGDTVYAAGAGHVVYAGIPGPGWGKMIILAHRVPDLEDLAKERIYQTVYAHLDEITVKPDTQVQRGMKIGTVGTGGGLYLAHLHFEVREGPYINPGQGYADSPLNRVSPEKFISQRRGAPAEQMNPAPALP